MPSEIILIAAVTIDGYIARHSLEVINWSKDLALFKRQTMGYPVVMGSNTQRSIKKELIGRETIVVSRDTIPEDVLLKIKADRCFIIGGGKTFYRFSHLITHAYISTHPLIFGSGVPLFDGKNLKEMDLSFIGSVEVEKEMGLFQNQYKVERR